MTASTTTRMSKRRALLCVMLAASLCAPRIAAEISAERREQSVQILPLAGPSPTILVNRGGPRADHGRQRTVVDSPFILLSLHRLASDRGRSQRPVADSWLQSRCAARTK